MITRNSLLPPLLPTLLPGCDPLTIPPAIPLLPGYFGATFLPLIPPRVVAPLWALAAHAGPLPEEQGRGWKRPHHRHALVDTQQPAFCTIASQTLPSLLHSPRHSLALADRTDTAARATTHQHLSDGLCVPCASQPPIGRVRTPRKPLQDSEIRHQRQCLMISGKGFMGVAKQL
jgi:hypothetical protein